MTRPTRRPFLTPKKRMTAQLLAVALSVCAVGYTVWADSTTTTTTTTTTNNADGSTTTTTTTTTTVVKDNPDGTTTTTSTANSNAVTTVNGCTTDIMTQTVITTCGNQTQTKTSSCTWGKCGDNGEWKLTADNAGGQCPSVPGTWSGNCLVDNISFNFHNWAYDFKPAMPSSGCSSCGGGTPAGNANIHPVGLKRRMRFRNEVTAGSFGIGGFASETDKSLTFAQTGGGVQVTVFDPAENFSFILVDGTGGDTDGLNGIYHDVVNGSIKEGRLLDASGNLTANLSSARWFDVKAHNGQVSRFEVIVTSAPSTTTPATPNDPSLRGRWTFDDVTATSTTTGDATGNAHVGAFPVQPTFVAGRSGQTGDYALSFNGTNQGVKIGKPADLNFAGQITMSAWIKPGDTNGWHTILGHGYTSSPQAQCSMEIYNGSLLVGAWPGTRPWNNAALALPANASTTWTHVVATYDGTNWNAYINGQLAAQAADASGARTVNANWWIGCSDVQSDRRFFNGAIDDVRVYNRPLTATEVSSMYGGTEPDSTGLLAQWGMNEGQGGTVADISGSASAAAHAGALTPTQPALVAGRTGQSGDNALHFDGNGWVNLGNATDMNLSGPITMTAWVKPDAAPGSGYSSILSHGFTATWFGGQNAYDYLFFYNGNPYGGSWNGSTSWVGATAPANLVGHWNHLAAEYDGNNWRMYVNGVFSGITTSGTGAVPVSDNWLIGASTQIADLRSFTGAIDDVRIYNRALTDTEIYALGGTQNTYGGRLVSIKDTRGYGLNVTYKYNPATSSQDASAVQVDPTLQWQMNTTADAYGNTVTYSYGTQQVAGQWAVSQASFSNGQSVTYAYGDGQHLTQVTRLDGSTSTYNYVFDTATQKTRVDINDTADDVGHEKKSVYLTNQITVLADAGAQTAQVWNQSAMMARMVKNGAGETGYMNFRDTNYTAGSNSMVFYEGGNKLKLQSADWQEQFFADGATMSTASGQPHVVGSGESFYASHGNQSPDPALRQHGTIPGQYKADGTWTYTSFDADTFPTSTAYADGSSESWAYDANHNITSHTDRGGRVETMTYDGMNNMLTRTVGTGADAGTTTYAYFPASDPNQYLLKSETDANGNTTDYTYDANHHLLTKTLPADVAGGTRPVYQYQYDSAGRLSQSTDPVGRYVKYTYDSHDRVVDRNYCDVSHEQTVYGTGDNANRVIASSDRDGRWTAFRYDAAGRVVRTIGGIAAQADAVNLNFQPDPAYHTVMDNAYLAGTNLLGSTTINGQLTTFLYDYRNRQIAQTVYPGQKDASGNPIALTTTSTYLQNSLFFTTDPYGRKTYYGYRGSDYALIRSVKESVPGAVATALGGQPTSFEQITGMSRSSTTANAPYTIEDIELDNGGLQTATVDARGLRSETQYDTRGRATIQMAAVGTSVQAQAQTIYDANSNVIEQRSPRYFDTADAGGVNKAKTVMTYSGRNLLLAKTEAPGTAEAGTTTFSYYLDGKLATTTLPAGNMAGATQAQKDAQTTIQMNRPLCGWSLGSIDQAGHGTLTNTTIGGDVIHTIMVKDLKSLTTIDAHGLVIPNFLNEVSMDVPDANTVSESTVRYDSKHRPIASTVWSGPLGTVWRDDVPVYFGGSVQGGAHATSAVPSGVTGQTTLYYYSENLGASATLTHPFGPALNIQSMLQKVIDAGQLVDGSQASARATMAPNGEVTVQIINGRGHGLINAKLDTTTP